MVRSAAMSASAEPELLPFAELVDAANLDPEFRNAARFWTARLRLEICEGAVQVHIADGKITGIESGGESAADLSISAPREEWEELLEAVPRPFYQDLFGALERHGFRLEGDLEGFYPYYPAARRLIELMREIRHAGA